MDEVILKGTTVTFNLNFKVDLTGWDYDIAFTTGRRSPLVVKDSHITCTSTATGCTLTFTLSQEETLSFKGDTTELQVRAVNSTGSTVGTVHYELPLLDAVNNEVVTYA